MTSDKGYLIPVPMPVNGSISQSARGRVRMRTHSILRYRLLNFNKDAKFCFAVGQASHEMVSACWMNIQALFLLQMHPFIFHPVVIFTTSISLLSTYSTIFWGSTHNIWMGNLNNIDLLMWLGKSLAGIATRGIEEAVWGFGGISCIVELVIQSRYIKRLGRQWQKQTIRAQQKLSLHSDLYKWLKWK